MEQRNITCAEHGHSLNLDDTTDTCLRCGEKVVAPGPAFVRGGSGDLAAIENRVLGWIAKDDETLDNLAVDRFAAAMKAKLAKKRAEGRGGWNDHSVCTQADLVRMLAEHINKGDPVDVANFCMFLWNRQEGIELLPKRQAADRA